MDCDAVIAMYIVIASSGAAHARLGSKMKRRKYKRKGKWKGMEAGMVTRCRYHVNDDCKGLRSATGLLRIEAKIESS
jgi:hypothetical protein